MPTSQPRIRTAPSRQRSRPLCEPLEPRQLLSANLQTAFGLGTTSNYGQAIAAIATDATGNVYAAGYFTGTMDLDPTSAVYDVTSRNPYLYDMYLAKYSAAGNLIWAKTFTSSGNDLASDLKLDPNGNLLLAGYFTGTIDMDPNARTTNLISNGGTDAFISQFDSDGNLIWARSFGGTGDDNAAKITSDNHGGYIILGTYQNTADLDPGTGVHNATASTLWDVYISHIDGSGNFLWSNQITAPANLYIPNIAVDAAGDVYADGFFSGPCSFNSAGSTKILGSDNTSIAFVTKYTPTGKLSFVKTFGQGTGNYGDACLVSDITLDSHNNIILAGSFGGTIDVNPGTAKHLLVEHQSPDAFTGYLLKLNSAGNYLWSGAFTGSSWSDAYAVTTDANDNIYLAGELNGTNTFDITGTSPNDTLTSRGQDDAFLAKYDAAGRLGWLQQMGGTGYDHGLHLAMGPSNSIYLAGYFNNTAHFGPQPGIDLTAIGMMDSFIAVFDQSPNPPAITLTSSSTAVTTNQTFTLTAAIIPDTGIPTGKIIIRDGTRIVGILTLDSTGKAKITLRAPLRGAHIFTVQYLGDPNFAPVLSSPLQIMVGS